MGFVGRVAYRTRQFWRALTARPLDVATQTEVERILKPAQQALFYSQPPTGQQHGYRVMRTLSLAGHDDLDLLAAALLHDVGKYRFPYRLWDRAVVVLAERLAATRATAWGRLPAAGWRRPFVVKRQHPAWGAESAREAGCSAVTVQLIGLHQDNQTPGQVDGLGEQLALLQWADNQN